MIVFTPFRKLIDLLVTLILWIYFILGFALIFIPYLAWLFIIGKTDEFAFQALFHRFFAIFFKLNLLLIPGLTIRIDPKLSSVRSSVIVCNHQSYLDPLLFIATFKKHKTIVKNTFFLVPAFGWFMKRNGYVPSSANGKYMALVLRYLGEMKQFLASGGNLFIFPEGTRSRNGRLNQFHKGAFTIADQSQAPVVVAYIKNTGRLFKPGTSLFNTCQRNTIEIGYLGTISPDDSRFVDAPEKKAEETRKIIQNRFLGKTGTDH
jgi:1-acyl-sn-glycerol-3-phosphate acyltransferase